MAVDDSYTKVLLHFNGDDASTTFTDESGKTWTAAGNAQLDTAQKKFGTASGLFDGTGDYISTDDHADFAFGTGDFTIDFWVRFNDKTGLQAFGGQFQDAQNHWWVLKDASHKLRIYFFVGNVDLGDYITTDVPSIDVGVWYHIAFVKTGTTIKIFLDGASLAVTETVAIGTNDVGDMAAPFRIGELNGANYFNGWIDEYRVSKGIARWTENFTPPTAEYQGSSPSVSVSASPSVSISPSPSVSVSLSPSPSPSISPSASPSISPSLSLSPSPSEGYTGYTRGDYAELPANDNDLENAYSAQNITDVATKDDVRVGQTGTQQYMIHQYKNFVGDLAQCTLEWEGQSTLAPSSSAVYLQIYNRSTSSWQTVDSDNTSPADTDFILTANITDLTDYKDASNVISCRIYQLAT